SSLRRPYRAAASTLNPFSPAHRTVHSPASYALHPLAHDPAPLVRPQHPPGDSHFSSCHSRLSLELRRPAPPLLLPGGIPVAPSQPPPSIAPAPPSIPYRRTCPGSVPLRRDRPPAPAPCRSARQLSTPRECSAPPPCPNPALPRRAPAAWRKSLWPQR